jgi:hypothetical protein
MLPVCEIDPSTAQNDGHFTLLKEAEAPYDDHCWIMRSRYHVAPACVNHSQIPPWQWKWTVGAALRGQCRMPDVSSASAVAHSFKARRRKQQQQQPGSPATAEPERPVTLLLLGLSFMAQPFEALVCAHRRQVVGGCLRFAGPAGTCAHTVAEATAGGAACTGHTKTDLRGLWPPDLHRGEGPPRQNTDECSAHHALIELSSDGTRGGTLRVCYAYTFDIARTIPLRGAKLPCALRAEEIDAIVTLHDADEMESTWFPRVYDPAAGREVDLGSGGGSGRGAKGGAGGVRGHVLRRPPYLASRDLSGTFSAAAYEVFLTRQLRQAYTRAGLSQSEWRARPNRCAPGTPGVPERLQGGSDVHYALPGLPDHAANVWLSMLATMPARGWPMPHPAGNRTVGSAHVRMSGIRPFVGTAIAAGKPLLSAETMWQAPQRVPFATPPRAPRTGSRAGRGATASASAAPPSPRPRNGFFDWLGGLFSPLRPSARWPAPSEPHTARRPFPVVARAAALPPPPCTPRRPDARPVVLVHIHKGGGSVLCTLALRAGLCAPPPVASHFDASSWFSKNCNPAWKDQDTALGYAGEEAMVGYARSLHVGFWGLEWAVPRSMPWASVDVIALVREPLRLTLTLCGSTFRSNWAALVGTQKAAGTNASVRRLGECLERSYEVHDFQTRRYAGCVAPTWKECRRYVGEGAQPGGKKEVGRMSSSELARASQFVERANVVLLTERIAEGAGPLLAHRLGWRWRNGSTWMSRPPSFTHAQCHAHCTHSSNSDMSLRELEGAIDSVEPSVLHRVRDAIRLDRQLHALATRRFERDLAGALRAEPPPTDTEGERETDRDVPNWLARARRRAARH